MKLRTILALTAPAAALLCAPILAAAQGDSPGPEGVRPAISVTGEDVYRNVCAACHMQDAAGAVGAAAIPGLASNPMMGTPEYPIHLVVAGRGAMPGFKGTLTDQQIADVVTYVRTHFGNHYDVPVTAAQVASDGG